MRLHESRQIPSAAGYTWQSCSSGFGSEPVPDSPTGKRETEREKTVWNSSQKQIAFICGEGALLPLSVGYAHAHKILLPLTVCFPSAQTQRERDRGNRGPERMLGGVGGREEVVKRKHQVPKPITMSRRGPLVLSGGRVRGRERGSEVAGAPLLLQRRPLRGCLNRLPVVDIRRPLDQIEASLGHLSCARLGETLCDLRVSE